MLSLRPSGSAQSSGSTCQAPPQGSSSAHQAPPRALALPQFSRLAPMLCVHKVRASSGVAPHFGHLPTPWPPWLYPLRLRVDRLAGRQTREGPRCRRLQPGVGARTRSGLCGGARPTGAMRWAQRTERGFSEVPASEGRLELPLPGAVGGGIRSSVKRLKMV